MVAGPLTGGSFNSARSLGPALAGGEWTAHWLYWIAPIGGVTAGMQLYGRLARRSVSPAPA
ncbi:MAG: aquaporin [Gemmatimonadales bacterium]